jgi:hypothetical protein
MSNRSSGSRTRVTVGCEHLSESISNRSCSRGHSRPVSVSQALAISFRLAKHYLCPKAQGIAAEALGPAGLRVSQTAQVSHLPLIPQVVRAISGVQAQVASAGSLALRARIGNLSPEDVADALWSKRDLVKTWCMRSTLHYLPSEDLAVYIAGLGPGIALKEQRWMARRGLDMALLEHMVEAVIEALSDGPLTRREIGSRVVGKVGEEARPWVEHSWGGVIKQACLRGLVCFGPDRGREVTFVQLDQWIPGFERLSDSEGSVLAMAKVLEQWLKCYGPATIQDFSFWSGVSVREAAEARSILGNRAVEVMADGVKALVMQEDLEILAIAGENAPKEKPNMQENLETLATSDWAGASEGVNLLACFDPFLLGHRDKGVLVEREHYKKVFRKAGWISPVILVGGKVVGTWDYTRLGKRLRVMLMPFGGVSSEMFSEMTRETPKERSGEGVGKGSGERSGQRAREVLSGRMRQTLRKAFQGFFREMPGGVDSGLKQLEDEIEDISRFLGFEQVEVDLE